MMLSARKRTAPSEPIVIIGGSIAGLMAGIVLTRLGHKVQILEQDESPNREENGAGITVGLKAQEFFKKFDQVAEPYAVKCPGVNYLDANSTIRKFWKRPMLMSTWSALYYRLRANFDRHQSSFCSEPPKIPETAEAIIKIAARVTRVTDRDGSVDVEYTETTTGTNHTIRTDLVVVADGASSTIRQMLLPGSDRTYSGYLGWRGLVPELEMSEQSRKLLDPEFTAFTYSGGYIMCYIVPGSDGSIEPGRRRFNWVWYSPCSQSSTQFKEIMTDSDGRQHRNSIPKGKMREDIWKTQQQYGKQTLNSVFIELLDKTKQPFLSVIQDYAAPQAVFLDGKVLLIGDALATFRPHMALSLDQAALDCLLLEKVIQGEITLNAWEREVVQYGYKTKRMNAAFGTWYMYGGLPFLYNLAAFVLALLPFRSWVLYLRKYRRRFN